MRFKNDPKWYIDIKYITPIILAVVFWLLPDILQFNNNFSKFLKEYRIYVSFILVGYCIGIVACLSASSQSGAGTTGLSDADKSVNVGSGKYETLVDVESICRNKFNEASRTLVENNSMVQSAQIYKLSKNQTNTEIQFRIDYVAGYVYGGIDINAILQITYKYNLQKYNRFRDVWGRWVDYINRRDGFCDATREDMKELVAVKIKQLIGELRRNLLAISDVNEIKDEDFVDYRLIYILAYLFEALNDGNEGLAKIELDWKDKEKIKGYLEIGKRTGILGSILLEDSFTFSHKGYGIKKGRVYITFPFKFNNREYILLCSFPNVGLDNEKIKKAKENIESSFVSFLKNKEK